MPVEERDVTTNQAFSDELVRLGSQGVPTLVVQDEVIIGFDQARLSRLLNL